MVTLSFPELNFIALDIKLFRTCFILSGSKLKSGISTLDVHSKPISLF